MATAYRRYALDRPGRYSATVRAPAEDDSEHNEAAARVLEIVHAVLSGYALVEVDAVDATRAVRATLHGFVTLESGGGFGMPRPVGLHFARLVDAWTHARRLGRPTEHRARRRSPTTQQPGP